jgi:hypothetical protein
MLGFSNILNNFGVHAGRNACIEGPLIAVSKWYDFYCLGLLVDCPTPPIGYLAELLFICIILIGADNEQLNNLISCTSRYKLRRAPSLHQNSYAGRWINCLRRYCEKAVERDWKINVPESVATIEKRRKDSTSTRLSKR